MTAVVIASLLAFAECPCAAAVLVSFRRISTSFRTAPTSPRSKTDIASLGKPSSVSIGTSIGGATDDSVNESAEEISTTKGMMTGETAIEDSAEVSIDEAVEESVDTATSKSADEEAIEEATEERSTEDVTDDSVGEAKEATSNDEAPATPCALSPSILSSTLISVSSTILWFSLS